MDNNITAKLYFMYIINEPWRIYGGSTERDYWKKNWGGQLKQSAQHSERPQYRGGERWRKLGVLLWRNIKLYRISQYYYLGLLVMYITL